MTTQTAIPSITVIHPLVVEMGKHLVEHGDGVKDIAFTVEDCRALYEVRGTLVFSLTEIHVSLACYQTWSCGDKGAVGGV